MSPTKAEASAGFVVFKADGPRRYLFLTNKGRLDLPKGLKQAGEDDLTTALRELREETGIADPAVIPGFSSKKHYFYRWKADLVSKDVIYFLARHGSNDVSISGEHDGYAWLTKDEALGSLRYPTLKEVVMEADSFLEGLAKKGQSPQPL